MARLGLLVSVLAALALLGWLAQDERGPEVLARLQALPWPVLLAVMVTQTISYGCRAARLASEFASRLPLGFWRYLRISLLHNASVNVIPMRGGELALPIQLQRAGLPFQQALATLIWLRLQDACVLGLFFLLLWPGIPEVLRWSGLLGSLAALALFRLHVVKLQAPARWPKIGRWVVAFALTMGAPISSWWWSLANWFSKLAGLSVLLAALADLPLLTAAQGALGGELSALLPVQGAAGFGTYEAGVVFALGGLASDWAGLLVPAVALHTFTLLLALLAGLLAWVWLPTCPAVVTTETTAGPAVNAAKDIEKP